MDAGDLTHGNAPKGDSCLSNKIKQIGVNPNIPKAQPLAHQAWPVNFKTSDFPCTRTVSESERDLSGDGDWWVTGKAADKQLKPGVICYRGSNWSIVNNIEGLSQPAHLVE
jgi:hypothetical protein